MSFARLPRLMPYHESCTSFYQETSSHFMRMSSCLVCAKISWARPKRCSWTGCETYARRAACSGAVPNRPRVLGMPLGETASVRNASRLARESIKKAVSVRNASRQDQECKDASRRDRECEESLSASPRVLGMPLAKPASVRNASRRDREF